MWGRVTLYMMPVSIQAARHEMPSGNVRVFYLDYSARSGSLALPGCDSSSLSNARLEVLVSAGAGY